MSLQILWVQATDSVRCWHKHLASDSSLLEFVRSIKIVAVAVAAAAAAAAAAVSKLGSQTKHNVKGLQANYLCGYNPTTKSTFWISLMGQLLCAGS